MPPEPFRPRHHLTPPKGWMNDPNGLIKRGDTWHVFYQHDPSSITHGPMHWGHASTRDFLAWDHHPIALAPLDGWTCFSGSAVQTEAGDVKLLFTEHKTLPDGRDLQHQSLVHADLAKGTFQRESANPVLRSPAPGPFRDPKVIWHPPTARWIMALTIGQAIAFHASTDLVTWVHLSDFGAGQGYHCAAPWECPDLIEMPTPDGQTAWVLLVGTGEAAAPRGTFTQYFVGHFDGTHFHNANPPDTVLWVDHGPDFYAAQTFFRNDTGPPVMLGWAANWHYVKQTPTTAFRGALSFPRELALIATPAGLRLTQHLPQTLRVALPEPDGTRACYRFAFTLAPGEGLTLFNAVGPQLTLSSDASTLTLSRTDPWLAQAAPGFAPGHRLPAPEGPVSGEVYVDHGITEISLADGQLWLTQLHFPADLTAMPRVSRQSARP
jgi:fructan beta-fructosidase